MGLFKPDLYRSFAIGFALGAALIGLYAAGGFQAEIASPAQAATAVGDPPAE